ncbi:MAG: NAD(P)/FAD-dependent oxidoreductase [Bacteroidetes bacterium]|nr:NAD(P)/FAD-dependent oxidoreductase [Bacteroidota bacterium]HET6244852.1 NAD(P)/FAD-dependent oxidoreductase [Bacteroidia bacterium]
MSNIELPLLLPESKLKRIVIAGGGFGGLQLCKELRGQNYEVVLIDRHNYHTFQPLLYQVATAGLEPDSIAYPFRKLFKHYPNFYFRLAEIEKIDHQQNSIVTDIGILEYDILILATGSTTNFYGIEGVKKYAFPMKTIPQALDLRSIILQNFEQALPITNELLLNEQINVVIVGGGPTGVEMSGALGELKNNVFPIDYPEIDLSMMQVYLVEAGERLLSGMSKQASAKALKYLEDFGINVMRSSSVKDFDGKTVLLSDGKTLSAKTLIWAAGVKGNIPEGLPEQQVTKTSRLKVDRYCKVQEFENIFAIGDLAYMEEEKYPGGHPMVAPVAIQQANFLIKHFNRLKNNSKTTPFCYKDKGKMATIGRNKAVVDMKGFKFQGIFAWFVWMFVHLMSLVGFRNRVVVLIDWFYNYISYDQALRLIIRPFKRR